MLPTPPYKVLLFYKYITLKDPAALVAEMKAFCEQHKLLGRILIAEEGINGTCAGTPQATDAYKTYMRQKQEFGDIWFKEQDVSHVPFKKLQIRARKEIVALGVEGLDPQKGGVHLKPAEVNKMVDEGKKNSSVVFFDVRNDVEAKVGRFENAITPKIEFFRELPSVIDQYENLKNKKVILYCTGGIRCEKASALFKKKGFEHVYQIEGGIYNYCNQYPDGHFKGTCFVFDDRMQIGFEDGLQVQEEQEVPDEKIISHCDFCNAKTKRVVNDERHNGHHLVVCCEDCDKALDISRIRFKKKKRDEDLG